jgi:hypothetical protein
MSPHSERAFGGVVPSLDAAEAAVSGLEARSRSLLDTFQVQMTIFASQSGELRARLARLQACGAGGSGQ